VLPVYNLVFAKVAKSSNPPTIAAPESTPSLSHSRPGQHDTIGLLAREPAQSHGRVIVNNTGLTGRYDLILSWTPDDASTPLLNGEPEPNAPPGLFMAIQDQLGLKLESGKGPVSVMVIHHIEPPSAN
jgi:uncharacterized protein (TIGR03435 family)